MNIVISEAGPEDAAEILALQETAFQKETDRYIDWQVPPLTQTLSQIKETFTPFVFLKAVHDTRLAGSVRACFEGGTCHISRLIVHPDYEGNGIGTQLMIEIETYFPQAVRFELVTGAKSKGSIRFYEKLGYRAISEKNLSSAVRLVCLEKLLQKGAKSGHQG